MLGTTQENVAKQFTAATGRLKNQGQVSKALKNVREWKEAGNKIPDISEVTSLRPKGVDPAKLDLGAPLEHRPPDQREKAGEE